MFVLAAQLALSVEHETLNLRVVGSGPMLGANCWGNMGVDLSILLPAVWGRC